MNERVEELKSNKVYGNTVVSQEEIRRRDTLLEMSAATPRFVDFMLKVHSLVEGTAKEKGYSNGGSEGQNLLYDTVHSITGNGHALGEIIYKAVRYGRKGLIEDVYKIAAWAYLIVRHGQK